MSNFEILACIPGSKLMGKDRKIAPNTYKLSASADFHDEYSKFTLQAVTLERIVADRKLIIMTDRQPDDELSDIWVKGEPFSVEEPLTVDQLNTALDESTNPGVRVLESDQYPNLLTAHRSIAIGAIALATVRQRDTIQNALIVPTGNKTQGLPLGTYPEGTLLMAVADPATAPEIGYAMTDLQQVLTA
jgi:hypothetical protein